MENISETTKYTTGLVSAGLAQLLILSHLSLSISPQIASVEKRPTTIESIDPLSSSIAWWDTNSGCTFNTGCGKDNA